MARNKDINWDVPSDSHTWGNVPIYILMDIRDELKLLNDLLRCPNFISIPRKLARIARNTERRKTTKKRR